MAIINNNKFNAVRLDSSQIQALEAEFELDPWIASSPGLDKRKSTEIQVEDIIILFRFGCITSKPHFSGPTSDNHAFKVLCKGIHA